MKTLPFLLGFFMMAISVNAQTTSQFSGIIATNTTWQTDTVFMAGDVVVADSVTLTIRQGTKVIPLGYYKLDVKGRLLAIGQPNNFIHFFMKDTTGLRDTSSTKGGWNGIHFKNIKQYNDSSILKYCRISNGKAVGQSRVEQLGGAIFIDSCSKILIESCQIFDNIAWLGGGGIQVRYNSAPQIIKNLIRNNQAYYTGGGISTLENSSPNIEQNMIINNICLQVAIVSNRVFYGGSGGAIYSSSQSSAPIIHKNIISNNTAFETAVYESTLNIRIFSNIIVNNHSGGIANGTQRSNAIYSNNTICNNYGMGISSASTGLLVLNNIIRGNFPRDNSEDNLFILLGGYPILRHNNIEMAQVIGLNNMNRPTKFVRPTTGTGISDIGYEADWRLQADSPEIDSGTVTGIEGIIGDKDVYGNKRIQGNMIDIGASEYTAPNSINTITSDKNIKIFPNPFSEQVWVEISDFYRHLRYQITSISGQIVDSGVFKESTNLLETHQLANGFYVLTIFGIDNKIVYSAKISKTK